jgi:hypothetical protein
VEPARHRSPRPRPAHRLGLPGPGTLGRDRGTGPSSTPVHAFRPGSDPGRLVDGQLGQRERLQPLIRNGSTAQHRGTVGAAARRASARSRAPHRSRSRSPRAWLVSSATRRPAPSTGSSGLEVATASSWSRATARPSCSSRRRSWSNRARARAVSTRAPHPPYRRYHRDRTGVQNPNRDLAEASIGTWPAYCLLVGQRPPIGRRLVGAHDLRHCFSTRGEDAGVPARGIDQLLASCRPSGSTAPYSGRGASSPNRNDTSTKRRPAVTSRTSCRCEQLNSSAAPAAGRYSSGPYSGKRS